MEAGEAFWCAGMTAEWAPVVSPDREFPRSEAMNKETDALYLKAGLEELESHLTQI